MLRIKPENYSRKIKPLIDLGVDGIRLESVLCRVYLSLFWGKYGFTVLPATTTCTSFMNNYPERKSIFGKVGNGDTTRF